MHTFWPRDSKRFLRCPACNQVFSGRKQQAKHACPKATSPSARIDGEA